MKDTLPLEFPIVYEKRSSDALVTDIYLNNTHVFWRYHPKEMQIVHVNDSKSQYGVTRFGRVFISLLVKHIIDSETGVPVTFLVDTGALHTYMHEKIIKILNKLKGGENEGVFAICNRIVQPHQIVPENVKKLLEK